MRLLIILAILFIPSFSHAESKQDDIEARLLKQYEELAKRQSNTTMGPEEMNQFVEKYFVEDAQVTMHISMPQMPEPQTMTMDPTELVTMQNQQQAETKTGKINYKIHSTEQRDGLIYSKYDSSVYATVSMMTPNNDRVEIAINTYSKCSDSLKDVGTHFKIVKSECHVSVTPEKPPKKVESNL